MLLHMSAEVWRAIGQLKNLLSNFLRIDRHIGCCGYQIAVHDRFCSTTRSGLNKDL